MNDELRKFEVKFSRMMSEEDPLVSITVEAENWKEAVQKSINELPDLNLEETPLITVLDGSTTLSVILNEQGPQLLFAEGKLY